MPPIHSITLANPVHDASAHADVYAFAPALLGFTYDKLIARYPSINRNVAAKMTELAASWLLQVPWMVVSHELGHQAAANRFGWPANVRLTSWMSGVTTYVVPSSAPLPPTLARQQRVTAAGVNQEQLNAMRMFRTWATNENVRPEEALGYLLGQTNLALYALVTLKSPNEIEANDIEAYLRRVEKLGGKLNAVTLAGYALATDLLSAPMWAALGSQLDFVARGARSVKAPGVQLGDVRVTLPNFSTVLDVAGPIVGASAALSWPRGHLQMAVHVRPSDAAIAATIDLPALRAASLSFSPRLGASWQPGLGVGTDVGFTLSSPFSRALSASLSVDRAQQFMLTAPLGLTPGLSAQGQVELRF